MAIKVQDSKYVLSSKNKHHETTKKGSKDLLMEIGTSLRISKTHMQIRTNVLKTMLA